MGRQLAAGVELRVMFARIGGVVLSLRARVPLLVLGGCWASTGGAGGWACHEQEVLFIIKCDWYELVFCWDVVHGHVKRNASFRWW